MLPFHRWIDSFHTGYNLECIYEYARYSGDDSYNNNIKNGLDYYINNFFTEEGIPKYYNIKTFPIDAHAPAQLVITIAKLNQFKQFKPLVDKVLQWTIANMQSEKGYFYFQLNKFFSSKIPYIRWSQAWMFYALSTYLLEESRLNSTNRP
jgi:rhamnogalacturonyl hydrolase YesR